MPSTGNKKQVLIIDDESRLLEVMSVNLVLDGFDVSTVCSGSEALKKIKENPPDIITLDIMMPRMDGFETLKRIRQISDVPVIMVTARGETFDTVKALDNGADDYLTMPFSPVELGMRILSVIRRIESWLAPDEVIWFGDAVEIDFRKRKVTVRGKETSLRPTECHLLYCLVSSAGNAVPNEYLVRQVWGYEYENPEHYLWPYITHLRQVLEQDPECPRFILDNDGEGFTFQYIQAEYCRN